MTFDREVLNNQLMTEFTDDTEAGQTSASRTKVLILIILPLIFVVTLSLAGYGWMNGYFSVRPADDGEPVLVRAEQTPLRVRPKDPGGLHIAHQDKQIYEAITPSEKPVSSVTRIVSEPEKPLPRKQEKPKPYVPLAAELAPPVPSENKEAPKVEPEAPAAPKDVAEVTPPAPAPLPAPVIKVVAPAAPKLLIKKKPAFSLTETIKPGAYVQLGAYHSRSDVEKRWSQLQSSYGDVLSKHSYAIEKADLGQRGIFYRLLCGPQKESAARRLCQKLKDRKQACFVVKK